MATYDELYDVAQNSTGSALRNRLIVAISIKANAILAGTPTAGQLVWATDALANPRSKADMLLNFVLADNKDATVGNITGASDVVLQTAVNTAVDQLVN